MASNLYSGAGAKILPKTTVTYAGANSKVLQAIAAPIAHAPPPAPGTAAAVLADTKTYFAPGGVVSVLAKTQDPTYTPTTLDIIAAGNLGLLDSPVAWNVPGPVQNAVAAGAIPPPNAAGTVDPTTQQYLADQAAAAAASGGYPPGFAADSSTPVNSVEPTTGHVVTEGEIRTFYVNYYAGLAHSLGLST